MRLTTMCLRNLFRRRARTTLCVVGIAFAVLFTMTFSAVTSKYMGIIKEMNTFFSGDIVVVAKGSLVINAFAIAGVLPETTAEKLTKIPGVQEATPILFLLNQPNSQEGSLQLLPSNVTIGVPAGNWSVLVGSTHLKAGSWPSEDSSQQIVIGFSLAENSNLTVGSNVMIKNSEFQVSGILDASSALLLRAIIMPLKVAQATYGYNLLVSMIIVVPSEGIQVKSLARQIETETSGTSALTDLERGETVEPLLNEVAFWNLGIGAMLFFMSMVLVITVAMINISERRRDLATLHAIGAPQASVFRTVLTETALLGFLGGLIGNLLGILTTVAIVSYYTGISFMIVSGDTFVLVPPLLMLETWGTAVLVSAVAGIIPAIAAARTNIAQILRAEY